MKHDIAFIRRELGDYSSRVSNGVRVLTFGVIAGTWIIFSTDGIQLSDHIGFLSSSALLKATFFLSAATLTIDLLQYCFGYYVHSKAHDYMQNANITEGFEYSSETLGPIGYGIYIATSFAYHLKFVTLAFAAISFCLLTLGISKTPSA